MTTPDDLPTWRHHQFLLALVIGVATFLPRLGATHLWDRDEPRNARCAWEMLERGDWVVPTFNGELRVHKPALLYWLIMANYACFGVNEFAARLGSALAASGTVGLTYLIAAHLTNRRVGLWSAVILATTIFFNISARAATPDALLIFWSTAGIAAYVLSQRRQSANDSFATCSDLNPLSLRSAVMIYSAWSLAVLAKGPIGIVLPGLVLLIARQLPMTLSLPRQPLPTLRHMMLDAWSLRPFTAIVCLLVIAAPWYCLVGWQTDGAWLRGFFWDHHFHRATQTMEGHAGHPLIFYPVATLVGFFPWSIFALPGLLWIYRRRSECFRGGPLTLFVTWIAVYVGLFSLASTKLPSYITPMYPALAILCAIFVSQWPHTDLGIATWWSRCSAGTLSVVGVVLTIGLPIAARHYLAGEWWVGIVGVTLVVGGVWSLTLFYKAEWQTGLRITGATAWLFIMGLFACVSPAVSRHQHIGDLLSAASLTQRPAVASFGVHEPSWIFYAGRTIPFYTTDQIDAALAILQQPHGALITTRHHSQQLQASTTSRLDVVAEVPYFLKDDRLVLITRGTTSMAMRETRSAHP